VSEITVRAAEPGDGKAIAPLSHDSAAYYHELAPDDFRLPDAEGQAEWLDSFLPADGEREIALVAEIDGQVAGYLEARLEEPLDSSRYQANPELAERRLFVNALVTARSHWRRGVGSALVGAAEAWGRGRGATVAWMDTYADSPVSVPFWHGRGYRTRGVIMHKRLDREENDGVH
jgi:GNAT superfamily N-acetyltransferase